jgi:hypothetical protein
VFAELLICYKISFFCIFPGRPLDLDPALLCGAGIDAGLYSRELMYHCQRLVSEAILPKSMLIRAHKATKATGSATGKQSSDYGLKSGHVAAVVVLGSPGHLMCHQSRTTFKKSLD